MQTIYSILKKNKICVGCRNRLAEEKRTQCKRCLERAVKRSKKLRETKGRCSRCGSIWTNRKYKTCDRCRLLKI